MRLAILPLVLCALARAQVTTAEPAPASLVPFGTPIYVELSDASAAAEALRRSGLFSLLDAKEREQIDSVLADLASVRAKRAAVGVLPALIFSTRWIVIAECEGPAVLMAMVSKRMADQKVKPATTTAGRFFVVAESKDTIETVGSLESGKERSLSEREDWRRFDARAPEGALRFHLDVKKLAPVRPGLNKNDDIGAVLFGHHLTHVAKTARTLSGALALKGGVSVSLTAEIEPMAESRAFTETRPTQPVIAPPPGCALRMSLSRDLEAFWNARETLLRESARAPLAEFQNNLAILMGGLSVEDVFAGLGSGFDVYVAQGDPAFPDGRRYPSAAIVGSLKDPALETEFLLTFQTTIGIVNAQRAMESLPRFFQESARHRDVLIATARLLPESVPDASDERLQLAPSLAVAKGRLIIGTNRRITEALVDQVLEGRSAPRAGGDEIELFGPESAAAYAAAASFVRSQYMLESNRTPEEAQKQFDSILAWLSKVEHGRAHLDIEGTLATFEIRFDAKRLFEEAPESR